MARRIQTTAFHKTGGGVPDTYFDRIVKYVPVDIVAAWTAVAAAVKAAAGVPTTTVLWVCLAFGVILTPFWTLKQTHVEGQPSAWTQAAVATAAFIIWVFALGGQPFTSLTFYHELYGSLAIIAFTLISGLIVPKE